MMSRVIVAARAMKHDDVTTSTTNNVVRVVTPCGSVNTDVSWQSSASIFTGERLAICEAVNEHPLG